MRCVRGGGGEQILLPKLLAPPVLTLVRYRSQELATALTHSSGGIGPWEPLREEKSRKTRTPQAPESTAHLSRSVTLKPVSSPVLLPQHSEAAAQKTEDKIVPCLRVVCGVVLVPMDETDDRELGHRLCGLGL